MRQLIGHWISATRSHLTAVTMASWTRPAASIHNPDQGHLGVTLLSGVPGHGRAAGRRAHRAHRALGRLTLYGVLAEIEALGLDLLEVRQITLGANHQNWVTAPDRDPFSFGLTASVMQKEQWRPAGGRMIGVPAGKGKTGERRFQPCRLAAANAVLPAQRRPGAGRGLSTSGRTSIPRRGGPSCRRYFFGALLFQVTGSSCRSRRPGGSWAASRRCSAAASLPGRTAVLDPATLREAGLSWGRSPRCAIRRAADGRPTRPEVLITLPDDELMAQLTIIPGIGPGPSRAPCSSRWSARTSCCRETWRCARPSRPPIGWITGPPEEVLAIADKWRPGPSLATSYLFSAVFEPAEPAEPSPVKAAAAARPRTSAPAR